MNSVNPPATFDVAQLPDAAQRHKINVLVVSSVALAFMSFWRAAAIVLCDLASTAYYIGGISEQAVGKAAPWFILAVMLFIYPVTSVYMESCTLFTRGGVYKVVKGAVGGGLAKLSVSALMFDYILTGPISSVAAGQYLVGLFGDMLKLATWHSPHLVIFDATTHPDLINFITMLIAIGITLYFWRTNIIGIHESSEKALRIMQLTTVMGLVIFGWSAITIWLMPHGSIHAPPFKPIFTQSSLDPSKQASSGWLEHFPKILGTIGILVAFGHSLLAMSGEESLAQVNREIEAPKFKNLLRAGRVIAIYAICLTGTISFLGVLIIPDGKRVMTQIVNNGALTTPEDVGKTWWEVDYLRPSDPQHSAEWGYLMYRATDPRGRELLVKTNHPIVIDRRWQHVERDNGGYRDNLINGLVHYLVGPAWIKIVVECFVVIVGFLILAGAVNTSLVGSNGVLNRLAEDGVLTSWFQHPHRRYGTTNRIINLVGVAQVVVILASLGDVDTLGEAYAFGVIWSFVFMSLSMAVLRFRIRSPREYSVPLNINKQTRHGLVRFPVGIIIVFLILFSTACVNLLTKKTATIWGIGFTAFFLLAFTIVERITHRRHGGDHEHLEQFNQKTSDTVSIQSLGLSHRDPVLVAARGPRACPFSTESFAK